MVLMVMFGSFFQARRRLNSERWRNRIFFCKKDATLANTHANFLLRVLRSPVIAQYRQF